MKRFLMVGFASFVFGCGGNNTGGVDSGDLVPDANTGIDPTDVRFGDTALVVVVNPVINDSNGRTTPAPGDQRLNIVFTSDDGVIDTTGADGIAVLAPLTAGTRTITVTGDNINASFTVLLTSGALREIALSLIGTQAQIMVDIDYKTDTVFEITPGMTNAEVNDALKVSDRVVFVRGGTYVGDLDLSNSRITLFGEGVLGGTVIIDGNATMSGSDCRIRGTHITGTLNVPNSGSGLSFSRIDGALTAPASDTTLMSNALCGGGTVTGSGSIVVGNAGLAPTLACP